MGIRTIPVYATLLRWDFSLKMINSYINYFIENAPEETEEIFKKKGEFEMLERLFLNLRKDFPDVWEDIMTEKKKVKKRWGQGYRWVDGKEFENNEGFYLEKEREEMRVERR